MPPEDVKTTDTKPEGTKPKADDTPPEKRLHKLRVNHKDVELPYDEVIRRAQIGMSAEELKAEREKFRSERQEAEAMKNLIQRIQERDDARSIMERVETAVLADKPLDLSGLLPEPGDSGEDGGEGRKPKPARKQTDPEVAALKKQLQEVVDRLAGEDRTRARTARQKRIEKTLSSDPVLKDVPEYASLADRLVPGLMSDDPDLKTADAEALAIQEVRKIVEAQEAAKHRTRKQLQDEFPKGPGGGSPLLSAEEKFTDKDVRSGKVLDAVKAAGAKFFGGT